MQTGPSVLINSLTLTLKWRFYVTRPTKRTPCKLVPAHLFKPPFLVSVCLQNLQFLCHEMHLALAFLDRFLLFFLSAEHILSRLVDFR